MGSMNSRRYLCVWFIRVEQQHAQPCTAIQLKPIQAFEGTERTSRNAQDRFAIRVTPRLSNPLIITNKAYQTPMTRYDRFKGSAPSIRSRLVRSKQ